uniref:Uncharacterized protein n=1 Tax=Zea mays TaxID=4577 RepID=C4J4R1_MAIZE|nr:unknown [Zea mays]
MWPCAGKVTTRKCGSGAARLTSPSSTMAGIVLCDESHGTTTTVPQVPSRQQLTGGSLVLVLLLHDKAAAAGS